MSMINFNKRRKIADLVMTACRIQLIQYKESSPRTPEEYLAQLTLLSAEEVTAAHAAHAAGGPSDGGAAGGTSSSGGASARQAGEHSSSAEIAVRELVLQCIRKDDQLRSQLRSLLTPASMQQSMSEFRTRMRLHSNLLRVQSDGGADSDECVRVRKEAAAHLLQVDERELEAWSAHDEVGQVFGWPDTVHLLLLGGGGGSGAQQQVVFVEGFVGDAELAMLQRTHRFYTSRLAGSPPPPVVLVTTSISAECVKRVSTLGWRLVHQEM
jgi:hypothetical protein